MLPRAIVGKVLGGTRGVAARAKPVIRRCPGDSPDPQGRPVLDGYFAISFYVVGVNAPFPELVRVGLEMLLARGVDVQHDRSLAAVLAIQGTDTRALGVTLGHVGIAGQEVAKAAPGSSRVVAAKNMVQEGVRPLMHR